MPCDIHTPFGSLIASPSIRLFTVIDKYTRCSLVTLVIWSIQAYYSLVSSSRRLAVRSQLFEFTSNGSHVALSQHLSFCLLLRDTLIWRPLVTVFEYSARAIAPYDLRQTMFCRMHAASSARRQMLAVVLRTFRSRLSDL